MDGAPWPGTESEWNGFKRHDFEVEGRPAYVVQPRAAAPGRPWVWRARFPGFHAEADLILLDRGFHIGFIDTNGMLGSPRAMALWDVFYRLLVEEHSMSRRPALEGVSRGGLFVYGWAARNPDQVACIYADTPVCDFKSWPLGAGTGLGNEGTWKALLAEYEFDDAAAREYRGNPIDRLAEIAVASVPILHIVSLNDRVVPPRENTFVLAERYRRLGGEIEVMIVAEGTAASNGHHFSHPDPIRAADFIERHASDAPDGDDYFVLRAPLANSFRRFQAEKTGRVVFMGGSITAMTGWRDMVCRYLQERFSDTRFEFVNAGIPSTGSIPGAFRMRRDALGGGDVDLLFVEAAVNDAANGRTETEMERGMEGILRGARNVAPELDIVVMHFADPGKVTEYKEGQVPAVIRRHEAVADYYGATTVHLAREVAERIAAGQFTWEQDFRDLHPAPFGQALYAATIRRMLSSAWKDAHSEPQTTPVPNPCPAVPMDDFSYDAGRLIDVNEAGAVTDGFDLVPNVDPRVASGGGGVRAGFHGVPMLVGTKPGDAFTFEFEGRAVGLFVAAGPDAGVIEYRMDDGEWREQDLFTRWSRGLHLPWAYVLADELAPGAHRLEVRIADHRNAESTGHACRVVHFLVNGR